VVRTAGASPETEHSIALAQALGYRAAALRQLNRGAEARDDAERAVPLARRFSLANPVQGRPFLADVLYHQALLLADVRRYEEAARANEEATDLFRKPARFNPAVYRRRLTACMSDRSLLLDRTGGEEGLKASMEAVTLARRRLAESADAEGPASALVNLGARLSARFRDDEAVKRHGRRCGCGRPCRRPIPPPTPRHTPTAGGTPLGVTLTLDEFRRINKAERYRHRRHGGPTTPANAVTRNWSARGGRVLRGLSVR
jgi:hypothetical protein